MSKEKHALLLVGSPKAKGGASLKLGSYILENLKKKGYTTDVFQAITITDGDEVDFLSKLDQADLIIVSFPLYYDSLPAPFIRTLELISAHRRNNESAKTQQMITIANCGFVEASQIQTALRICKCFAEQSGFQWLGGLALGGGGVVENQPIEAKGMTANIAKALDLTIEAAVNGMAISDEACRAMSKQSIPSRLYAIGGNLMWKKMARKMNTLDKLYAKPYQKQ